MYRGGRKTIVSSYKKSKGKKEKKRQWSEQRRCCTCCPVSAEQRWSWPGSGMCYSPGRVLGGERNAQGAAGSIMVGIQEPLPVSRVINRIVPVGGTKGEG